MTGGDLTLKLSFTAPSQLQAFLVGFPDTMVAMKAMKAGARAMTGGDLTKKNRRDHAAQEQGREGCVRRPADRRLRGGEEDREVCHSPAHDAQVEAQARTEGGHQGDVREGGEGGGETRLEGGEGFPRESTQGLDLSHPRQQDFVGLTRSWSCHGLASNTVHGRRKAKCSKVVKAFPAKALKDSI